MVPPVLERILLGTPALERACLVGGCVRDHLLGLVPKDFDIEVYGLAYDELQQALRVWGRVDLVGRSFGVVKLTIPGSETFDFSIPRRDSKIAPGHRGFAVDLDPGIGMEEAARRRDYTINAILYDPRRRVFIDPLGGREDLQARVLRHTGPHFADDPLRVLRGMQFVARFQLAPHPATVELCRNIQPRYHELAAERIRDEWLKWAMAAVQPSAGLRFLQATNWIAHYPELEAMASTPQDPEWHPEGDVLTHTGHCCDALSQCSAWRDADPSARQALMFAVLAHDIAKPQTTRTEIMDGKERITSPGHEAMAATVAEALFERLHLPRELRTRATALARHHMAHLQPPTARSVRRLALRLAPETIEHLALVIEADHRGRPPRPPGTPAHLKKLLELARQLQVQKEGPKPILQGRHLLHEGLAPHPSFRERLQRAFEAQLDGQFHDLEGARAWLRHDLQQTSAASPTHPPRRRIIPT